MYLVLIIDNERSTFLDASPVPHLSLAGTESLAFDNLINILKSLDPLEENVGFLGLGVGLDLVGDNQGDFGDLVDAVTLGHDKSGYTGSSNSRHHGVTLLSYIDPAVPTAVNLGGGKHVTATAHVSESTLARTMGTATTDTGNTSNSATGTPGLGTSLVTCTNIIFREMFGRRYRDFIRDETKPQRQPPVQCCTRIGSALVWQYTEALDINRCEFPAQK